MTIFRVLQLMANTDRAGGFWTVYAVGTALRITPYMARTTLTKMGQMWLAQFDLDAYRPNVDRQLWYLTDAGQHIGELIRDYGLIDNYIEEYQK